jgi:hypothetical protein
LSFAIVCDRAVYCKKLISYILKTRKMASIFHHIGAMFIPNALPENPDDFCSGCGRLPAAGAAAYRLPHPLPPACRTRCLPPAAPAGTRVFRGYHQTL